MKLVTSKTNEETDKRFWNAFSSCLASKIPGVSKLVKFSVMAQKTGLIHTQKIHNFFINKTEV